MGTRSPAPSSKSGGIDVGTRPTMSNCPTSARAAARWLASDPFHASMYAWVSGNFETR